MLKTETLTNTAPDGSSSERSVACTPAVAVAAPPGSPSPQGTEGLPQLCLAVCQVLTAPCAVTMLLYKGGTSLVALFKPVQTAAHPPRLLEHWLSEP